MFKKLLAVLVLSVLMVSVASATNPPNIQNTTYCVSGSVLTTGADSLHTQYACEIKSLSEADCKTEIVGILTTIITKTNYEGAKGSVIASPYKSDGTNNWNLVPADIKHNLSCRKTVN